MLHKALQIAHLKRLIACTEYSPFKTVSGGFYHDCAVHDIDLVCWIMGEYPSSVFAQGHAHNKDIREMGDVDTTIITLTFPSGVLASIDLSRNASYGYDQRCEVKQKAFSAMLRHLVLLITRSVETTQRADFFVPKR